MRAVTQRALADRVATVHHADLLQVSRTELVGNRAAVVPAAEAGATNAHAVAETVAVK